MISPAYLYAVGLFIFGSFAGFFRKVAFQVAGRGQDDHVHNFEKPWFTTLLTTVGCALSLTVYSVSLAWGKGRPRQRVPYDGNPREDVAELVLLPDGKHDDSSSFQRRRMAAPEPKKGRTETTPFKNNENLRDHGVVTWAKVKKLMVPALLYQIGVVTQGVGLRYTSASVNQILSGSGIVFTAIFSFWFLKRSLNWRHWIGLGVSCIGIGIVSSAEIFIPVKPVRVSHDRFWADEEVSVDATTAQVAFGVYMTMFSQLVSAAQMVWEEAQLTDLRLHPLQVMGWEGVWGLGLDLLLLMPLAHLLPGPDYQEREENSVDTLVMLTSNSTVALVSLLFLVTVAATSQLGILVSQRLGSMVRAILLTARTALIWLLDLLVFFWHVGPPGIGEDWTPASPWQCAGFMLLLLGTWVYATEPRAPVRVTPLMGVKVRVSPQTSPEGDAPPTSQLFRSDSTTPAGYQALPGHELDEWRPTGVASSADLRRGGSSQGV